MSEAPKTAPPPQTLLRIAVLAIGILGGLSAAWVGFTWYSDMNTPEYKKDLEQATTITKDKEGKDVDAKLGGSEFEAKEFREKNAQRALGWKILMAALPIGIIAGIMAFLRILPLVAAALFVAAFASPALFGFNLEAFIGFPARMLNPPLPELKNVKPNPEPVEADKTKKPEEENPTPETATFTLKETKVDVKVGGKATVEAKTGKLESADVPAEAKGLKADVKEGKLEIAADADAKGGEFDVTVKGKDSKGVEAKATVKVTVERPLPPPTPIVHAVFKPKTSMPSIGTAPLAIAALLATMLQTKASAAKAKPPQG